VRPWVPSSCPVLSGPVRSLGRSLVGCEYGFKVDITNNVGGCVQWYIRERKRERERKLSIFITYSNYSFSCIRTTTTTTTNRFISRDQSCKTEIGALWWCWTVLSVSRYKQFKFEITFKTSAAFSRSTVYRQRVPCTILAVVDHCCYFKTFASSVIDCDVLEIDGLHL